MWTEIVYRDLVVHVPTERARVTRPPLQTVEASIPTAGL